MIAKKLTVTTTPATLYSLLSCQSPYCRGIILKPDTGSITFGDRVGTEIVPLDETIPMMLMDLRNLSLVGDGTCFVMVTT